MTSRKRTNTAAASSDGAIVKIVYFDEGSAADYVQIEHGGALDNVTTLLDQASSSGTAGVQGEASAKTKLLKALFGVGVSGDIEGSFNKSFVSGTIVKSIISNTVLTDFLNTVESSESSTSSIVELDKLRIEKIPGSISSMTLLTPYFSMFRNGQLGFNRSTQHLFEPGSRGHEAQGLPRPCVQSQGDLVEFLLCVA